MATDFTGFMPEETGAEQIRVESFFKPNLQLIDRVLATRQQMYNTNLDTMAKAKAKVDEVNALEGYDKEEWFKMQQQYDNEIAGIMSLYEGDLSKANAELYGFSTKVGKDFGIHGKATAINERALGYMMNKKELDKRLAERKIERGQYWRLEEELERTKDIGIGTDPKAYNSWRKINPIDAIDFDEFATKFLATKESDLIADGWKRKQDEAGYHVWENVNRDVITYESILKELGDAFRAKAQKTGQLVDDFDYNLYKNQIKMTNAEYVNKYTAAAAEKRKVIEQLKATPKTNEEKIAQHKLLNDLQGKETQATGILTSNDVATKQLIIDRYEEAAKNFEAEADKVKVLNNDQLRAYYYEDYTNSQIRRLADPYAASKSRDKVTIQRDMKEDKWLELEIYRRKKEIDKEFDNVEPVVTQSEGIDLINGELNQSLVKSISGLKQSKTEIEGKIDELEKQYKLTPNDNLRNQIATLKKEHGQVIAKISTLNDAQFKIDEKMKKVGMQTNKSIVSNEIIDRISLLDNASPTSTMGQFNGYHYALLVNLTEKERKDKFGTSNIEEIKKKPMKDVNKKLYDLYSYSFTDILDPNKQSTFKTVNDRISKVTEWTSENLYDDAYNISTTFVSTLSPPVEIPSFEALRKKVEDNSDLYVKKTNDHIMTEQTEFLATDPTKGNQALNALRTAYANALHTNPQGFVDIHKRKVTGELSEKNYINAKKESTNADLSQTKPEDITVAKKAIDGVMYMQVRLRDAAGNLLYESNGEPATTWVVPEQQTLWNSNVKQAAIENINALTKRVMDKKANYDQATMNGELSMDERLQYFEGDNKSYINHLTQLASVNHLVDWQSTGLHRVKKGSNIYIADGTGGHYAIHRTQTGQWSIYGVTYDKEKNPVINTIIEPYELINPHLGVKVGAYKPTKSRYFNSPEELATALEFTRQFEN